MLVPRICFQVESNLTPDEALERLRGAIEETPAWWIRTFVFEPGKKYLGVVDGRSFKLQQLLLYQGLMLLVAGICSDRPAGGTRIDLCMRDPGAIAVGAAALGVFTLVVSTFDPVTIASYCGAILIGFLMWRWLFRREARRLQRDLSELLAD